MVRRDSEHALADVGGEPAPPEQARPPAALPRRVAEPARQGLEKPLCDGFFRKPGIRVLHRAGHGSGGKPPRLKLGRQGLSRHRTAGQPGFRHAARDRLVVDVAQSLQGAERAADLCAG